MDLDQKPIVIEKGIIVPVLNESFNPHVRFAQKGVNNDFKKYLLDLTPTFSYLKESVVNKKVFELTEGALMVEIAMRSDGVLSKEEILWRIYYFTEQQSRGQEGLLDNSGNANFFGNFLCNDGVVRTASVYWWKLNQSWVHDVLLTDGTVAMSY